MLWFFTTLVSAFVLAVFQASFLSRLPGPWNDISIPLIAISLAVLNGRTLTAALWALVAGLVLDLHGLFGFGTEIALLFLVFAAERLLFERVLTNASNAAAFLLTAAGGLARFFGLLAIDGIRVVFGQTPYLISFDPSILASLLRGLLINGLLTVLIFVGYSAVQGRIRQTFLPHVAA